MSETLVLKGRLSKAKTDRAQLEAKAAGLRAAIRGILDPFEKLALVKTDRALELMKELDQAVREIRELDEQIAEMERALG
jgi:transposase